MSSKPIYRTALAYLEHTTECPVIELLLNQEPKSVPFLSDCQSQDLQALALSYKWGTTLRSLAISLVS